MGKLKNPSPGGSHGGPRVPRSGLSIIDLVREQGTRPVRDLDELGGLLPGDAGREELLAFVERERKARRASSRQKDA